MSFPRFCTVCLFKVERHSSSYTFLLFFFYKFSPNLLILTITIIRAHVFSQILYCLPLWGEASQQQLYRIQKVINFATRVVTGVKRREHITPALNSLHWTRIGQLVEERDCLKVYYALHDDNAPAAMQSLFTRRSEVATRETRLTCTEQLHLPKVRLSATQKFLQSCSLVEYTSPRGTKRTITRGF